MNHFNTRNSEESEPPLSPIESFHSEWSVHLSLLVNQNKVTTAKIRKSTSAAFLVISMFTCRFQSTIVKYL